jgi:hypothetical protein
MVSLCGLATGLIQPVQDFGKPFRYCLSDNVGVHRAKLLTDRDHDVATEVHLGIHFSTPDRNGAAC